MPQKPRFTGCFRSLQGKKSPELRFFEGIRAKRNKLLVPLAFLFLRLPAGGLDIYTGPSASYSGGIYGAGKTRDRGVFSLLNIPLGGRAGGLPFTAVADDVSFLESNPAGSARLEHTELAFFHNDWFVRDMGGVLVESLAYTHRLGNLGLAAGGRWFSSPMAGDGSFDSRPAGRYYSEIAGVLNGAYNFSFGPGFSGIAAGVNLKGVFRAVPVDGLPVSAVMADLGVLSGFNLFKFYESPEWNSSLGLAIKNLGPFPGEDIPSLAVLGLAYRPLEPLLFSLDLFLPFNIRDIKQSEKPYFSAGLEFAYGDFPSLRGSLQLKQGSIRLVMGSSLWLFEENPSSPAGARLFRSLSLDLDYSRELLAQGHALNRLGLGIRVGLGKRETGRVETLYTGGLEAYAKNDYPAARRCWEEALKLDPEFLPAAEALAMLEETLAAARRVEEFLQTEF
jgi:hypothetical protein